MDDILNGINKLSLGEKYQKLGYGIESGDAKLILNSVLILRKDLSIEKNPPIQEVVDANIVPKLVRLLDDDVSDQIKFETVWALTNIASGTSNHTETVVKEGACPRFIKLLSSSNQDILEQVIWALGNIAGDSAKTRDYLLQMGVLGPLLEVSTSNPKISLARNLTWTISNLTRGKPKPDFQLILPVLPFYQEYIKSTDEEVLADLLWSISYYTDGPNEVIQTFIDLGLVPKIIPFLTSNNNTLVTPALRIVGNIVTGDDSQTEITLNCGVLKYLKTLLKTSSKNSIIKEACWTVSNITAGNQKQIQHVIDEGLIQVLVNIAKKSSFDVKKEAIWAISNGTSGGSFKQLQYIHSCGALDLFVEDHKDAKIISICLEGIENIFKGTESDTHYHSSLLEEFESKGGVDYLEALQSHPNQNIYEKALFLLETYFGVEDEEMDASQNTAAF